MVARIPSDPTCLSEFICSTRITLNFDRELLNVQPSQVVRDRFVAAGRYGEVWLAKKNGHPVALKTIRTDLVRRRYSPYSVTSKGWSLLIRDYFEATKRLLSIDHLNIVKLRGVCLDVEPSLIMETMSHGTLPEYFSNNTRFA